MSQIDVESQGFISVFNDLKLLLKTRHVDVLGSFRWVDTVNKKGVIKKSYECKVIKRFVSVNLNSCQQWYLNVNPPEIELIIDFRIANMGDVTLHKFKLTPSGIREVSSKMLKMR